MPKQVRLRRGTSAQHTTFTGADGEVTVDTTKRVLVLHDGATPGGKPLEGFVRLNGSPVEVQTIQTIVELSGGVPEDEKSLIVQNDAWFKGTVYIGASGALPGLSKIDETTLGPTLNWKCTGLTTVSRLLISQGITPYSATTNLNFDGFGTQTITLSGNLTLSTSNLAAGKSLLVRIICDAAPRTLTCPAGWKFVGDVPPTDLAANKVALLHLHAFGSADSDVVGRYLVEP